MGDNSFKIMLEYDKKILNIEKKVKYLESIIDNIKLENPEKNTDTSLDYKNSSFYQKYYDKDFLTRTIANRLNLW